MNKSESKYFNTAVKMDKAFISLLEKKDFEYITVKEICARAGVNRSTFYLHYETVSDLLMETLDYINSQFLEYFDTDFLQIDEKIRSRSLEELIFITPDYLKPYLEFIQDHKKLFSAMIARPDAFSAQASFQKLFTLLFNPIMECFRVSQEEKNYLLAFYIQGILGVILHWLKTDCRDSTETVAGLIVKYVFPTKNFFAEK